MTTHPDGRPDPVEIAAGAWQLLPVVAADVAEISALEVADHDRQRLLATVDQAAAAGSLSWTVRTAVGGFIDGLVVADFDDRGATVTTAMTPHAADEAAHTAVGAVSRYLAACGVEVGAPPK